MSMRLPVSFLCRKTPTPASLGQKCHAAIKPTWNRLSRLPIRPIPRATGPALRLRNAVRCCVNWAIWWPEMPKSWLPPRCAITASCLQKCVGSRSEEHTSELQSLMRISYAVFCLKKQQIKADELFACSLQVHATKHKIHTY